MGIFLLPSFSYPLPLCPLETREAPLALVTWVAPRTLKKGRKEGNSYSCIFFLRKLIRGLYWSFTVATLLELLLPWAPILPWAPWRTRLLLLLPSLLRLPPRLPLPLRPRRSPDPTTPAGRRSSSWGRSASRPGTRSLRSNSSSSSTMGANGQSAESAIFFPSLTSPYFDMGVYIICGPGGPGGPGRPGRPSRPTKSA